MAKLIFKWRYIRPGAKEHNRNLVKYIATRPNVDKLADQRDNYVRYISYRPGAHGLFSDANTPIDLNVVAEEVANHPGIVMTEVLSLRREDAVRLGYDRGETWRDLLRSQTAAMASAMHIPLSDLRWYAAFHDEAHHPHCHIVAYSAGKEPHMSQKDLEKLKASFAHEIFKQDLLTAYQEQTVQRDSLTAETREKVQRIVAEINEGTLENEVLGQLLLELSERLHRAKGKKVYGYLPQKTRELVNSIVDELAKDDRLAELYELWYAQRERIVETYHDQGEEKLPLSQNKTFHAIKNIVVTEALSITPSMPEKTTQNSPTSSVRMAGYRIAASLARMFQENIDREQKQIPGRIDRKLRQKIQEKKQAQGMNLG